MHTNLPWPNPQQAPGGAGGAAPTLGSSQSHLPPPHIPTWWAHDLAQSARILPQGFIFTDTVQSPPPLQASVSPLYPGSWTQSNPPSLTRTVVLWTQQTPQHSGNVTCGLVSTACPTPPLPLLPSRLLALPHTHWPFPTHPTSCSFCREGSSPSPPHRPVWRSPPQRPPCLTQVL